MASYKKFGAVLVLSFFMAPSSGRTQHAVPAPGEGPTSSATSNLYATKKLEGWTVLVNKELIRQQPELVEQVLKELEHQLYKIMRRVPFRAVRKLKSICIWVEEKQPDSPCIIYRSDPKW